MKRKVHEKEVRKKILISANKLFMDLGYQQTTVRQITRDADIQIGTLYHFFKDKEDIFKNIVLKIFDRVIERTEALIPKDSATPELLVAAEIAWHFHAMKIGNNTAELYFIAYQAPSISKEILRKQNERNALLFSEVDLNTSEYFIRTIMCKGFLQSISMEIQNGEIEVTDKLIEQSVSLILGLFRIEREKINEAIRQMQALNIASYLSPQDKPRALSE